ncbi:MAG: adenine deaminase [Deltaproteobacteria bacterium]|nr:adenine deaminase [Deltaproteobacteria bacterium]
MSERANIELLQQRIRAARGQIPAELVLKRGKVVNVFSGEILEKDVAIHQGRIVGIGEGYAGRQEVDAQGRFIVPGLIDGHMHVESTMLLPSRLAASLLVHGTTAIVSDPHEIANVMGLEGIRFLLKESEGLPFDLFFMAPSCVPATSLETSGASLEQEELLSLREEPRILGLAEVMNYPGVLDGDEKVLAKLRLFGARMIDGHAPSLLGRDLQAYCSGGIRSDHETSDFKEAEEKLRAGMMIMMREGTSAKNLEALVPLVKQKNSRRFCLVTDDLHPEDLLAKGHLDHVLRKAVRLGVEPLTAIQMVSLHPAEFFRLHDRGAIAPGYRADLVVFEDLERFLPERVYKDGRLVALHGETIGFPQNEDKDLPARPILIPSLSAETFRIRKEGSRARVIELIPGQILTRERIVEARSANGWVVSDIRNDVLKLVVLERHRGTGRIGRGLVRGFGLQRGALASSVAHDSHNLIAVGVEDLDLFAAIEEVRRMGGGLVAAEGGSILAKAALGIGGLMSKEPLETLSTQIKTLSLAAKSLGCTLAKPFMALSFLSLAVIPELKLTDRGLVDVRLFAEVPLFV